MPRASESSSLTSWLRKIYEAALSSWKKKVVEDLKQGLPSRSRLIGPFHKSPGYTNGVCGHSQFMLFRIRPP